MLNAVIQAEFRMILGSVDLNGDWLLAAHGRGLTPSCNSNRVTTPHRVVVHF